MAKALVTHSQNACTINLKGDKFKNPEPETCVIKFPGGHVEVSRTTDGNYWMHLSVDNPKNVIDSRIDYDFEGYSKAEVKIPSIPHEEHIQHIAVMVAKGELKP